MYVQINKVKVAKLLKKLTEEYFGNAIASATGFNPIEISQLKHQKKSGLRSDRLESLAKILKVEPFSLITGKEQTILIRLAKK